MIRGTINEGISSLSKQRHLTAGLINDGVGGESYESINTIIGEVPGELRDAIDDHNAAVTQFPSNAFNGTFE